MSISERLAEIYGGKVKPATPAQVDRVIKGGTFEQLEPFFPPTQKDISLKTELIRRKRYNRKQR